MLWEKPYEENSILAYFQTSKFILEMQTFSWNTEDLTCSLKNNYIIIKLDI